MVTRTKLLITLISIMIRRVKVFVIMIHDFKKIEFVRVALYINL